MTPRKNSSLIIGIMAAILCGLALINRQRFFESYLFGYLFFVEISLASLGFLLLRHLTGGRWAEALKPFFFSRASVIPVLAVLFIPIVLGLPILYLWARPEAVQHDALLQHKSLYLNAPFFTVRAALHFAIWIILLRQLKKKDGLPHFSTGLGGAGLVIFFITFTFSLVDWAMSLEPHWFSSIYGAMHLVEGGLLALSLGILFLKFSPSSQEAPSPEVCHDIGNLLFAFVLLAGYMNFSQFLIIWYGNLPEEVSWYAHRAHHGWSALFLSAFFLQFLIPFFGLLIRDNKRNLKVLANFALMIFIGGILAQAWYILPAFRPEKISLHLYDLLVPLLVGGIWKYVASLSMAKRNPS